MIFLCWCFPKLQSLSPKPIVQSLVWHADLSTTKDTLGQFCLALKGSWMIFWRFCICAMHLILLLEFIFFLFEELPIYFSFCSHHLKFNLDLCTSCPYWTYNLTYQHDNILIWQGWVLKHNLKVSCYESCCERNSISKQVTMRPNIFWHCATVFVWL